MSKKHKIVQILVTAAILLGLLLPLGYAPQAAEPASLSPALAEIAADSPGKIVRVIVQKTDDSEQARNAVESLGGEWVKTWI